MTMLEERISSMEGAYDHLATKADVQDMRGEMRTTAAELRTEMETVRGDLIAEIRASEIRMIKWGAGMMVGMMLGMTTVMAALLRLFL